MDIIATHPSEEARCEIERMLVELGRMDPPSRFSKKYIRPQALPKTQNANACSDRCFESSSASTSST